eukprot:CAMPEP_0115598886 /NCGR_PEP_ID=MMETSP0272-20121206/14107_1 /TAXON_ID=71861 /ORGANISM="Scrippsiella trochoidea, Strain CCMP3099" /LENGTH=653 /DNA_ID=CAMNT_0003034319 /DNA_START=113 /DNA_END=2070 /DNA_ORIENTATION=+
MLQLRLPAVIVLLRLLASPSAAGAAVPDSPAPPRGVALLQTATQSSKSMVAAASPPHSGDRRVPRIDDRRRRRALDARALAEFQASEGTGRRPSLLTWRRQHSKPKDVSLVAVGGTAHASAHRQAAKGPGNFPDSDWFGGFDEAESTWNPDGVDHWNEGLDSLGPDQSMQRLFPQEPMKTVMPAEWFEESPSGGPHAAWQTYSSGAKPGLPHRQDSTPEWRRVPMSAGFEELYPDTVTAVHDFARDLDPLTVLNTPTTKDAAWFDTSVKTYDSFGRQRAPSEFADQFYYDWGEKYANTTLTCGPPGCTANASLQVVDINAEQFHSCRLSVAVHPTDFDDDHSQEYIEWIAVNGNIARWKCDPKASSGVISVRCFVRPIPVAAEPFLFPGRNDSNTSIPVAVAHPRTHGSAALQCMEPGCQAETLVTLRNYSSEDKCHLTIQMRQTDFDGSDYEEVEWVKVNGIVVQEHVKPGRNPCKEAIQGGNGTGSNGTGAEPLYLLLDTDNISIAATLPGADASVSVSAKISAMVDECGAPSGHLFDANVTIDCGNGSGVEVQTNDSSSAEEGASSGSSDVDNSQSPQTVAAANWGASLNASANGASVAAPSVADSNGTSPATSSDASANGTSAFAETSAQRERRHLKGTRHRRRRRRKR